MKVLIQRVKNASVSVEGKQFSEIDKGILAFIGVEKDDNEAMAEKLAKKLVNLRIFPDENKKMNKSVIDVNGKILVVSQFTLCGDCKKGTRPSFDKSAPPNIAKKLYEDFIKEINRYGVETGNGEFGAMMEVKLLNDGPVTFMLEEHI